MNYNVEADIVRSLGRIINNGHFHQGAKPVYWCMDCESALAEAEVEYQDRQTWTVDVAFPIQNTNQIESVFGVSSDIASNASMAIWTTTPWTLPANQFVAVNAELPYVLRGLKRMAQAGPWFCRGTSEALSERYGIDEFTILGHTTGHISWNSM